tara:strand:- start:194 stop:922 length:729 start_codon:yes stop_codon:yes gene_type:complete
MTVKSLLQIILFLLIIIIVGGMYFLYFYSGTQSYGTIKVDNNSKISQENMTLNQNNIDKDNQLIKIEENKSLKFNEESISDKPKENKDNLKKNKEINNSQYVQNLTKEIEYITSTKNGDIIKIFAKSGKTNLKNNNILELEDVNGTISSDGKSNIYISSKFAEYNYSEQNSKFYEDVEIKYIDRVIICDNFDLKINDNIAVAYNNVMIRDNKSLMKAEKVTMNILTKDVNIESKEKIEINTK